MDNLLQFLNRLGIARVAAMATVAVLMLGFFAFLIMRSQAPVMAPVYSGLSLEDSSAIIAELQTSGIPYELQAGGETILVPRDQITTLRMQLAGEGLPSRGQVGYEIFDQQSTLGATSFVQNINNVRALEGELSRTISSLARVQAARVHLVLPERELFQRERREPSASIVVTTRGELSSGEVRAIQQLVASAIDGLATTRVSLVDSTGRLLASGNGDENALIAGEASELAMAYENRVRTRLEDLLANVVGPGRARVEVNADIDHSRSTTTSETYDPESQVVRSTQLREQESSSTDGGSEQVSVANELPGATTDTPVNGMMVEQGSTTEETTNYEISSTTETVVNEAGGINRISVAVVVDGIYADDGNGSSVYQPRTAEELQQIATLVRSAIGYSEQRGDTVEVVNMQFAERPDLQIGTDEPGLFDFTRDDLMQFAEMAVTVLIALALILFIMRPLLKRVLTPEPQPLALADGSEQGGTLEGPDGASGAHGGSDAVPLAEHDSRLTDAKNMGEAQVKTLRTVGALIEENPKQAAMIVRDWLNDAA
ncbi:flagellar M-ring protein [Devosia pacifica]|uniref:Flagellar M-ring protein n=1 Tax=Devosia pacifica TaxID=1335967 RepID=A0A918S9Y4_9HYPH|nr:flagellar basal-body MS-ring/collar protein FliF [Devosia pacifica]GHA28193.1 flagellar M-ring protein [Devosia pacifica]